ncbi:sulfurtransferase TusA family protein [Streptomyces sp. NPDC101194]|uniref:sulfurtransferase TusA family protein n=1 Tax=Streptomyces sp. NPDC101194 TaxID=3366127 RepID=UPI003830FC57
MTAASVPTADITVDGTGLRSIGLLRRLRKQIHNAEPGAVVHVIATTRPPRSTCPPGATWPATPTPGTEQSVYALQLTAGALRTRSDAPWHPDDPGHGHSK